MAASIEDVARLAQVSISTVSRVINRRDLVSEKTRVRVEQAIRTLGYRPNPFARGLMLRRSELIALVLPDLHGEFYSEIIRGASEKARELDYGLVVSSVRDGDDSHSLLAALQQRSFCDGVAVMVSEVTDRLQETLSRFALPFVVIDEDIDTVPHDSVVINQRHGALLLVQHLLDNCGARRIIFVGGPETNMDTRARLETTRQVAARRGVTIRDGDIYFLDYQFDTAHILATRCAHEWAGAGNCVFAANDEMAAGILTAAGAAGLKVPGDLAVVGFDDTRIARMTRPTITTARVPKAQMGATAVELLCLRLADAQRPSTRISLQPELVVRESCGALLRSAGTAARA